MPITLASWHPHTAVYASWGVQCITLQTLDALFPTVVSLLCTIDFNGDVRFDTFFTVRSLLSAFYFAFEIQIKFFPLIAVLTSTRHTPCNYNSRNEPVVVAAGTRDKSTCAPRTVLLLPGWHVQDRPLIPPSRVSYALLVMQ